MLNKYGIKQKENYLTAMIRSSRKLKINPKLLQYDITLV